MDLDWVGIIMTEESRREESSSLLSSLRGIAIKPQLLEYSRHPLACYTIHKIMQVRVFVTVCEGKKAFVELADEKADSKVPRW